MKRFKSRLFYVGLLLGIFHLSSVAQETRELSGTIALDIVAAERDLMVQVSVRNHGFIVLPSFAILRPLLSIQSDNVVIPKGSNSASYRVTNIALNPVDYSIEYRCINCSTWVPTQYYGVLGNRFVLGNAAYLDPNDLPLTLDATLLTRGFIRGQIMIEGSGKASRDLKFDVAAVSSGNSAIVYQRVTDLTLRQGERVIDYELEGLSRDIGTNQIQLRVKCRNCVGASAKTQVFDRALSPLLDHTQIDFLVSDSVTTPVVPMLDLIL